MSVYIVIFRYDLYYMYKYTQYTHKYYVNTDFILDAINWFDSPNLYIKSLFYIFIL